MKDLSNAGWAAIFLTQASIVALAALFSHADQHIILAVLALSTNIVTGAFAYIQGHRSGVDSVQNPTQEVQANQTKEQ